MPILVSLLLNTPGSMDRARRTSAGCLEGCTWSALLAFLASSFLPSRCRDRHSMCVTPPGVSTISRESLHRPGVDVPPPRSDPPSTPSPAGKALLLAACCSRYHPSHV